MRVHIPSALRRWTGGRDVIEVPLAAGARITAAETIEALAREYPGLRDRVLDEQGAEAGADSEMWIHPALSGGARS